MNAAAERLYPMLQRIWDDRANRRTAAGVGHSEGEGHFSVEVVAQTASTNSALMDRARRGDRQPVAMIALSQTAGRGRMGKSWTSEAGNSLTFSVSVPMAPLDWSGLSLAVGVAVAEGLAEMGRQGWAAPPQSSGVATEPTPEQRLQLKWPNDVWLNQAKLGGILIETANVGQHRQVVVGVGLNLCEVVMHQVGCTDTAPFPPMPVACWDSVVPTADAADVLEGVLPGLVAAMLAFEQQGFAPFHARYAALDALAELPVVLSDGTAGTARGVNERGELCVETVQGMRTIHSAEVSIRPQAALKVRTC